MTRCGTAASRLERDRREQPAVIALAAPRGAAVAEEQRLLRAGVVRQHRGVAHAGAVEPRRDVALEVEQPAAGLDHRAEERGVVLILGEERRGELRPDLVGTL